MLETAALVLKGATALLFLLLLIRIAYVLASNPIGELSQELLYLRSGDLRAPALFLALALLLEISQFVYLILVTQGLVQLVPGFTFYVDAVQALFILSAIVLVFLVVQRYTHRGLDRRIRDAMETLAYLAGQRRRRSRIRGGATAERAEGGEGESRRYD